MKPHLAPYVHQFAVSLENRGIETSVLTTRTSKDNIFEQVDKLNIYRMNANFPFFSMLVILKKIKPDIIHIHAPNQFSCNALMVSKLLRIPVVVTVHRAEIDKTSPIYHIIRRVILSRLQNVVAVSNYSKDLAIKAGIKPRSISVIYNSCDESQLANHLPMIAKFSQFSIPDKKLILFVGNIIKLKGIDILIDALSCLVTKIDYHALIIGSGESLEEARQKVSNLNLNKNVSFLGQLPHSDLGAFYRVADIFVLPSFTEGNSVALLEAMFMGVPIVASRVGGNPEAVIDGLNGYLFDVGDSKDLSTKMEKILADEFLRDNFARSCHNLYNTKFSKKKQLEQYLLLYHKVLALAESGID